MLVKWRQMNNCQKHWETPTNYGIHLLMYDWLADGGSLLARVKFYPEYDVTRSPINILFSNHDSPRIVSSVDNLHCRPTIAQPSPNPGQIGLEDLRKE